MSSSETTQYNISVFDIDGTLIADNIGVTFVKYLLKQNHVKLLPKILLIVLYPLYKSGILDFKYAILMGALALAGQSTDLIREQAEKCFINEIKPNIYADGIKEIQSKKNEGDFIMLATGAHSSIAEIFAQHVGADAVISTKNKINDNSYTITVLKPLPYRKGKSDLVYNYIKSHFSNYTVTVYTDEEKDLSLLERADKRIGVNADEAVQHCINTKGGKLISFS